MTSLVPSKNCWRIEKATRCSVIVDADDYFSCARSAMLKAKKRIMLIGWDFDARIELDSGQDGTEGPRTVGAFIYWLVQRNPELEVFLLRWDLGAVKSLFRGTTILTLFKWMNHPRIHTRLDGHHPTGGSHHQKIVSIDNEMAFCGGIDMTGARWDTRKHRDDDPGRCHPNGKPYGPWHDATTALEGPVASALADLCRERWHHSGGHHIAPISEKSDCWPDSLDAQFSDVDVAIARTLPEMEDFAGIREIEQLYIDQIACAKRFIYAESQYFASRVIAEAISKRLQEPTGPEIVIINPLTAEGWLEPVAMDTARARLFEGLRKFDPHKRLRIYHPFTANGHPIYVHAKIMIVDDCIIRVGSSNMNNRSMGLDSECDVTIDNRKSADAGVCEAIVGIRDGLIAEHLGKEPAEVRAAIASENSLIGAIDKLRGTGKTLRTYDVPDLSAVKEWLADNEVLDPEGPSQMVEGLTKRHLFPHRR